MNCWPPFIGTRVHIEHIAPDWQSLRVRMKLSTRNKNYVGTHFGGGLFTMTDPFYVVLLMNVLGRDYVVWDKSTQIQFIAPGRSTVRATIEISEAMQAEIRAATATGEKFEPTYRIDILDDAGKLIARVDKTIYIRKKQEKPSRVA